MKKGMYLLLVGILGLGACGDAQSIKTLQSKRVGTLWGYVNTEKEMVIPAIYQEVEEFSDGIAKVKKDNHWGFIDERGVTVIDLSYDFIQPFQQGFSAARIGNDWQLLDRSGRKMRPVLESEEDMTDITLHENLIPIYKEEAWHFMNSKGKYFDFDLEAVDLDMQALAE